MPYILIQFPVEPYLLGCQKKELDQHKEENSHNHSAHNIFTISRVGMFENGGSSGFHGEFRNISLDTDERVFFKLPK
jgi:hypothetical protein